MDIFNISEIDFLNPFKIKIIDGIAGAGKSSIIHQFYAERNISYMRCTSTNRLKRDAERRYNIPCYTIASGLFYNEDGFFYKSEKSIECDNVVIDEILQADIRVLNWIKKNVGKVNIIITTDTAQMLAPKMGKRFLQEFEMLCKSDNTIYRCLTETKRARDADTKSLYNTLYNNAKQQEVISKKMLKQYKIIKFSEMPFNPCDIYITHTKVIEDRIYRKYHIALRTDIDRIPKAFLASKPPKDLSKYPCFSQLQAESTKSNRYTQASNIATPTRYQGSEVVDGQTLYYIINPKSRITAREFYTVLTRCWYKDSLVIVIDDTELDEEIKTFFNKPVRKECLYNIQKEDADKVIIKEDGSIDKKIIERIIKDKEPPEGFIYSEKAIVYDREVLNTFPKKEKKKGRNAFSLISLTDREEIFDFSFMGKVYKTLEQHGIDKITPITYKNDNKDTYNYELDLFSAFPTILAKEYLPIDGDFYYDETREDLMHFYLYKDCIVTDTILKCIPPFELEYLFSLEKQKGCKMGEKLYNMAHDTIENKAKVKEMHYGVWRWKYLEEHKGLDCYILHPDFTKELIMVAINTVLYTIAIGLETITGDGYSKVDAWHFNGYENVAKIKEYMLQEWGEYDYRINDLTTYFIPDFAKDDFDLVTSLKNEDLEIKTIYQTYDNLKTDAEKKKEQARIRQREKRKRERERLKRC